jgi:hypothetical protein
VPAKNLCSGPDGTRIDTFDPVNAWAQSTGVSERPTTSAPFSQVVAPLVNVVGVPWRVTWIE